MKEEKYGKADAGEACGVTSWMVLSWAVLNS
jgi:hypothetical protein